MDYDKELSALRQYIQTGRENSTALWNGVNATLSIENPHQVEALKEPDNSWTSKVRR